MSDRACDGDLGVAVRFGADEVVVLLSGEVDSINAADLQLLLDALIDGGHRHLVLDLAEVTFMDLTALRVLADTARRVRQPPDVMKIRSPSATTRRLFDITALSMLVDLQAAEADAPPLGPEQTFDAPFGSMAHRSADVPDDLAVFAVVPAAAGVIVDAALEMVTALARATVGGADGVSVTLTRRGRLTTVAASDETIAQMDRDQYATGEGPCLAAAAEGRWFHVESLAEEDRWPSFVPRALDGGIGSILSSPLMVDARPVGALNIYSRSERAFGSREQELAALFAANASAILAGSGASVVGEEVAQRLQAALGIREVIAQAQGVVMARQKVPAEAAYAVLRRRSSKSNIPLRLLAGEIVASTHPQLPSTGNRS